MDYTKLSGFGLLSDIQKKYVDGVFKSCSLKGYSFKTIKSYCYNVILFFIFLNKSSLNLNNEGVRCYIFSIICVIIRDSKINFYNPAYFTFFVF